jgi:hypothetical protein
MLPIVSKHGKRTRQRGFIGAVVALLLLGSVGWSSVSAFSSSVPATILRSACQGRSTLIHWRGGDNNWNTYQLPHGTVVVCYTKYRLGDSDPTGDYYAMEISSEWTLNSQTFYPNDDAVTTQYAISNTGSIDDRYGWTKSFTSSRSCTSPFSVGLNLAIFSITTSPSVCSGYGVSVINPGSTGATWKAGFAGEMREIETTFVQKVPNGTVPKFSLQFRIPYYIYTYKSGMYYVTPDWDYYPFTGI